MRPERLLSDTETRMRSSARSWEVKSSHVSPAGVRNPSSLQAELRTGRDTRQPCGETRSDRHRSRSGSAVTAGAATRGLLAGDQPAASSLSFRLSMGAARGSKVFQEVRRAQRVLLNAEGGNRFHGPFHHFKLHKISEQNDRDIAPGGSGGAGMLGVHLPGGCHLRQAVPLHSPDRARPGHFPRA